MDDATSNSALSCPACRVLDRADGVEDGKLYKTERYPVGNERHIAAAIKRSEDRVADRITAFAGSLNCVYSHAVWLGVWIAINVWLLGVALKFDKSPFGLLTMLVSLEAIFLATFVMVSQNRRAARSDLRIDLVFE